MVLNKEIKDIHAGLVERCKAGSADAFHLLYESYKRQMYSISLRILHRPEEAEDVLQESFIAAFQRIHTFKGDSTFGAWLKRIVINKSINALKKSRKEWFGLEEESLEMDEGVEEKSYPDLSVEQIKKRVSELPEGYRLVLTLFLFEGFSHRDIAGELGISESTSKSQYNRAKKKLRILLSNEN